MAKKSLFRQLFWSTTLWYVYQGRTFEQAKFPAYNHYLVNFKLKVSHSIGYFDNMTLIDKVRMKSSNVEIIIKKIFHFFSCLDCNDDKESRTYFGSSVFGTGSCVLDHRHGNAWLVCV